MSTERALPPALAAARPANDPPPPVAWRTVAYEAQLRGLEPRALRELCRRHDVPIKGTGKNQMVRPADVDAIFDAVPTATRADDDAAAARAAVARELATPGPARPKAR